MHRQVTNGLQYPWPDGDPALANYQTFTPLHTRSFPYLYTYAHRANRPALSASSTRVTLATSSLTHLS
jgi:hypothetical protein